MPPCRAWWTGRWYGWWVICTGRGFYEEYEDLAWDVVADITADSDGTGHIVLWDTAGEESLAEVDIRFGEGTTEHGAIISAGGYFMDAALGSGDWVVDPGVSVVSSLEHMIAVAGSYQDPEEGYEDSSFEYCIFLRPWGMDWEDVRAADTGDMPYEDMMPLDYENWYLPQISGGNEPAAAEVFTVGDGLYTVEYDPAKWRTATEDDWFGDLFSLTRERLKLYVTTLSGEDFVREKMEALAAQEGVRIETLTVDGREATLYVYEDWLGPNCELVIPLEERVSSRWGSMDAVYIYATGDTMEDVDSADVLAVMKSVRVGEAAPEPEPEPTPEPEPEPTPEPAVIDGPGEVGKIALRGGDGIVSEEAVQKTYVWLSEILDAKAFELTYDQLAERFGTPGLFGGEEYSEHMEAYRCYFSWISESDAYHYLYVNFQADGEGTYRVCGYNTSGFSGAEARDRYLEELKQERLEEERQQVLNGPRETLEVTVSEFAHEDNALTLRMEIPAEGWTWSENKTKLVNSEDPSDDFGKAFIQFKLKAAAEDFDFYRDSFENYQELGTRVIAGITMTARSYKYIGYEWVEHVGQVREGAALSIGIVRADVSEGSIASMILDSLVIE